MTRVRHVRAFATWVVSPTPPPSQIALISAFHETALLLGNGHHYARTTQSQATMGEGEVIKDTYPASKLGEYTVIQEIAEGTFGKVKSGSVSITFVCSTLTLCLLVAVHTVTGHRVAMKFISKHVINMTKTKTRVQREVEYMRTLRHPHIIKLCVSLHDNWKFRY